MAFSRSKCRAALARRNGWDCIRTTVHLGSGDYERRVGRGGVQIVLNGEPKAVASEVDSERFLERLARDRITGRMEAEVRDKLEA